MKDRLIHWLSGLNSWADKADWHTWVLHGLIAVPIALVFSPLAAIAVYVIRELEQYCHELIDGVEPKYLDHIMDITGPIVALMLLYGGIWAYHFLG